MLYIESKDKIAKLMFNNKCRGIRVELKNEVKESIMRFDILLDTLEEFCDKVVMSYILRTQKCILLMEHNGVLKSEYEITNNVGIRELENIPIISEIVNCIKNLMRDEFDKMYAEYINLLCKFKKSDSSFITSERDVICTKLRKFNPINLNEVEIGIPYLLTEGWGSIYKNYRSIGYFTACNSTVVIHSLNNYEGIAEIQGMTFKVIVDAPFANKPAVGHTCILAPELGTFSIEDFPRLISYDTAIAILREEIKARELK